MPKIFALLIKYFALHLRHAQDRDKYQKNKNG
jgi:hypothetical protein